MNNVEGVYFYGRKPATGQLRWVFLVIAACIAVVVLMYFVRGYQRDTAYIGSVTGDALKESNVDLCQPYLECMKTDGKRYFEKMESYEQCLACIDKGKCPMNDGSEGCRPGHCVEKGKDKSGVALRRNTFCDAKKPVSEPCTGYLERGATHCKIADANAIRAATSFGDYIFSFLPVNFVSGLLPENPLMTLQKQLF